MDAYEATKIVFERIQNLDPQNASKIMGFLLIQDHGEKEMIRLAFGSESSVQAVIFRVKKELGLGSPNTPLGTTPPASSSPFSNPRELSRLNLPNQSSWRNSTGGFADFQSADDLISPTGYTNGEIDLIDELQLQNQLSFLNDGASQIGGKHSDLFYHDLASSPSRNDAVFFPSGGGGGGFAGHRRSFSVSDDDLSLGFGWKPCLFYARGYCKNGTTCRFLHGAGAGGENAGDDGSSSTNFPNYSPILLQLPSENSPRSLMMDKFAGIRELGMNGLNSPGSSRQIYLTFPADSTFKEEDVSNYFSNFGPVQDVRIPYQQKRMFGFVTFDYSDTVRLILAKGNPHFVCDARVLVKPYKEKGKIPDKHRKQMERGEFAGCGSPTGMEMRDPYDFQLGARTFYNTPDMLLRKKLEDQVDLQQAIEFQNRRLMNLRLHDIKRNSHHRTLSTGSVISSPTYSPTFFSRNVFACTSPGTKQESSNEDNSNEKENSSGEEKVTEESERFEHLPDSPFALVRLAPTFSVTSSPSSADVAPFKSCYFQAPRFASGHETVGM